MCKRGRVRIAHGYAIRIRPQLHGPQLREGGYDSRWRARNASISSSAMPSVPVM